MIPGGLLVQCLAFLTTHLDSYGFINNTGLTIHKKQWLVVLKEVGHEHKGRQCCVQVSKLLQQEINLKTKDFPFKVSSKEAQPRQDHLSDSAS